IRSDRLETAAARRTPRHDRLDRAGRTRLCKYLTYSAIDRQLFQRAERGVDQLKFTAARSLQRIHGTDPTMADHLCPVMNRQLCWWRLGDKAPGIVAAWRSYRGYPVAEVADAL